MTDDLVKRLRVRAEFTGPYSALWDEAADRIEELEKNFELQLEWYLSNKRRLDDRIEKLEAALRSVLQYRLTDETWVKLGFDPKKIRVEFDAARKALEKKDD